MSFEFIESKERWQKIYELLPEFPGKIYYSHAYYSACAANGDGQPAATLLVPDQGTTKSCSEIALRQGHAIFYPFLMRPIPAVIDGQGYFDLETAYGYGGPQIFNASISMLSEFDRCFKDWARQQRVVAEFIRFNPLDSRQIQLNELYPTDLNRITVSIELDNDFSNILHACTATKQRNWRRAQRDGLLLREIPDLNDFAGLYRENMRRLTAQPFYYFSPAYFAAIEKLPKNSRFFAGVFTREHKLAAAAIFLLDADSAHYHLGASNPTFYESQPNVFMMLEFARQQAATGRKMLHLGGGLSLRPDDRLYRFKAGLAKNRHNFFIGRRVHQPDAYREFSRRWQALTGNKPDILLHYHYGVENADL